MPLFARPKQIAKSKAEATPQYNIKNLKEQIDLLQKREDHLRSRADDAVEKAKAEMGTNKKRALEWLRRKQMYEGQAVKLSQTRFGIEGQLMGLESASMNVETMDAMKAGSEQMRSLQKGMTLEDVDGTMDDIEDTMAVAAEISDSLARTFNVGEVVDDDDLLEELEGMHELDVQDSLLATGDDAVAAAAAATEGDEAVATSTEEAGNTQPATDQAQPDDGFGNLPVLGAPPSASAGDGGEADEFAALEASMNL